MAYTEIKMDLHLFEGGAAGASAAPAAGAGEGGEAAVVSPGTLNDGTQVDARLAARMEEQARKRRARGEAPVQAAQPAQEVKPEAQPQAEQQAEEPSLDDQWAEAKKKFKDQYGRDVKAAVDDRFKNQKDASQQLAKLTPALKALARQRGIDEGDMEALAENILNDDSLFEEEAEKAGMTVEGYRTFQQMKAEHDALAAREQEEAERQFINQHLMNLAAQADELKKVYPGFDLQTEMENETFRRLVAPNSGLKLADAFYAIHHRELESQAVAYGAERRTQEISQTLAANRARPVEGALTGGQPANIAPNPASMTREERAKLIERARRGEKVVF